MKRQYSETVSLFNISNSRALEYGVMYGVRNTMSRRRQSESRQARGLSHRWQKFPGSIDYSTLKLLDNLDLVRTADPSQKLFSNSLLPVHVRRTSPLTAHAFALHSLPHGEAENPRKLKPCPMWRGKERVHWTYDQRVEKGCKLSADPLPS